MKNLLSLFKPSAKEQAIEDELNGKPSTRQTPSTPPRRGPVASPATPGSADVELSELRASLASIEARLQTAVHERDSIRAEFSQYREAVSQDQRALESENKRLRQSLDETGRMLSKQIAGSGLDGPISEGGAEVVRSGGDEIRGLQRSIAAAKAEASATTYQRPVRPTL